MPPSPDHRVGLLGLERLQAFDIGTSGRIVRRLVSSGHPRARGLAVLAPVGRSLLAGAHPPGGLARVSTPRVGDDGPPGQAGSPPGSRARRAAPDCA